MEGKVPTEFSEVKKKKPPGWFFLIIPWRKETLRLLQGYSFLPTSWFDPEKVRSEASSVPCSWADSDVAWFYWESRLFPVDGSGAAAGTEASGRGDLPAALPCLVLSSP